MADKANKFTMEATNHEKPRILTQEAAVQLTSNMLIPIFAVSILFLVNVCLYFVQYVRAFLGWKKMKDEEMVFGPFILVLIDGDDTQFLDHFVQQGSEGGGIAAHTLRAAVLEQLEDLIVIQPEVRVFIQVYANLEGLSRVYNQTKIVSDPTAFSRFVQGFNKSDVFCDFTDAGNDKEAADSKIKGRIDLFYRNIHCKHIILGASGDNSYTLYLRQLALKHTVKNRLTLLRSKPFPKDLSSLATKFNVASFENVFRKTDLVDRRITTTKIAASQPKSDMVSGQSAREQPSTSSSGIAGPADIVDSSEQAQDDVEHAKQQAVHMCFNKVGQRIDQRIDCDQSTVNRLMRQQICHRHFLSRCAMHQSDCKYKHAAILTSDELTALRYLAQTIPCKDVKCRDPTCISGHRCPRNYFCKRGVHCLFPRIMHKVDTRVASEAVVNVVEGFREPA